jgi:excisionase family DNA binding protein
MSTATEIITTYKQPIKRVEEEFFFEEIVLRPVRIQDPDHELIEVATAAELLVMHRPNVTQLVDRGRLRVVRRSGSRRRWLLRSEVMALAVERGV